MKVELFTKWMFIPLAVLFLCTLGVSSGKAQTGLQLSLGTSNDDLNVTGTGGQTIDVNDRTCSGGTCIFGNGSANTTNPTTAGTYMMTTPTQSALTLTAGGAGGSYTVSQSAPVSFNYSSTGGNLIGTLQFLSATDSPVNGGGVSIVSLIGTLTATGGTLASDLTTGSTGMTVNLALYNSLASLLDGTTTLTAQVESGSITPEPASIFLFGSGLLVLGFLLRQRRNGLSFTPAA